MSPSDRYRLKLDNIPGRAGGFGRWISRGSKSNSSSVDTVELTVRQLFKHASAHRLHCTQSAAENSRKLPSPSSGTSSLLRSAPVGQNTCLLYTSDAADD